MLGLPTERIRIRVITSARVRIRVKIIVRTKKIIRIRFRARDVVIWSKLTLTLNE